MPSLAITSACVAALSARSVAEGREAMTTSTSAATLVSGLSPAGSGTATTRGDAGIRGRGLACAASRARIVGVYELTTRSSTDLAPSAAS